MSVTTTASVAEIDRELCRAQGTRRLVLEEVDRLEREVAREVADYLRALAELDEAIDAMLDLRIGVGDAAG